MSMVYNSLCLFIACLSECNSLFQDATVNRSPGRKIDVAWIDTRLRYLDSLHRNSESERRKCSVQRGFEWFLSCLPSKPDLYTCCPDDVRRFLIWKDKDGKTKVHGVKCPFLGSKGPSICPCPTRFAAASVANLVQKLSTIFESEGRGNEWCIASEAGNPARAPSVKLYIKQISEEQAQAQVTPKQTKQLFLSKIKRVSLYINNQLMRPDLSPSQRFVLLRDQTFFKMQFFGGDRASDLSRTLSQSVRYLLDKSGIVISHTFTKSIRGLNGRCNTFVLKRCEDPDICPVAALERYVTCAKDMAVDLSLGHLFRLVSVAGVVLDQPVNYPAMYDRLIQYLVTLGIYDGETPHSLRAGCAVTFKLSGASDTASQAMKHIGWFSQRTYDYYSREDSLKEASSVAQRLSSASPLSKKVEADFSKFAAFSRLPYVM